MTKYSNQAHSVTITAPGTITITHKELPKLQAGQFMVETLCTGVSTGTELTFFLGTNPKSNEGWDSEHRLFRGDIEPDLGEIYPTVKGYMAVGKVILTASDSVQTGDIVAMRYGHHSAYVANDTDFFYKLPADFDPELGILVSQMGPVCMNGILFAADEVLRAPVTNLKNSLVGQRIVIFGAGMVGMLVGLMAQWAGAKDIIIVDGIQQRLDMAERLGMRSLRASDTLPLTVKELWKSNAPTDTGADIAFQCTGSDYLLALGLSALREQGTVIDLGFYQQGAPHLNLGKEFHHNCLRHICAQIGSQPRHQQPNWNRHRLSEATIDFLRHYGKSVKETLYTHTVSFNEAQHIFDSLAARDPAMMQVLFTYDS